MLYAIGLGPGDKKLLTLKAVEIIKKADEVIVPGKMAYELVKDIREPRIVEFPMGDASKVVRALAEELAFKSCDVAFCCLGDPMLYSTFHHLYSELVKINPRIEVEIVPGITSVSCALAKTKVFVEKALLVTTPEFHKEEVVAVMKSKKPKEIAEKLKSQGFSDFWFVERMFMEDERITKNLPENADYFSLVVAKK
ncbi:MAG: cobalt-factor II C(20)-methyltransferase [Archaeoglobaceae archaeon]